MINACDYGFKPGDPTFDNSLKLNEWNANPPSCRSLYFPAGGWYFNSQPDALDKTLVLCGDGINGTAFIRNYQPVSLLDGLLKATSTINVEKLAIQAAAGTSGGAAICLFHPVANDYSPNSSVLRDLYITGCPAEEATLSGMWGIPVIAWSDHPMGIRSCHFQNLDLFAASVHLLWLVNVHGIALVDVNGYPASGGVSHATVQHCTVYRSANVFWSTFYLTKLYAYNTDNLRVYGVGTTALQQSGCVNAKLIG